MCVCPLFPCRFARHLTGPSAHRTSLFYAAVKESISPAGGYCKLRGLLQHAKNGVGGAAAAAVAAVA